MPLGNQALVSVTSLCDHFRGEGGVIAEGLFLFCSYFWEWLFKRIPDSNH